MAYGGYEDLTMLFTVFAEKHSKKLLVEQLEIQAGLIAPILYNVYDTYPVHANGSMVIGDVFTPDATLTVGSQEYTFVASPSAVNQIEIGATAEECAKHLHNAILQVGSGYHSDTEVNTAVRSFRSSTAIQLMARKAGVEGNDIDISTTDPNISITDLSGGARTVPLLIGLNVNLTAIALLSGKASSNLSGKGVSPLLASAKDFVDRVMKQIENGAMLETTEMEYLTSTSMCPITDGTFPAAGMDDPANWYSDPSRYPDRG